MNILLCGGAKTTNIANALRPRFKKGGVEILVETSIDNIKGLLDRGEYFDRAVIMEPGWTNDGSDTDEYSIRTRIASFIDIVRNYASRVTSCIFVATDDNMAQIAGEESILIANQCKILIKRPPYNVAFCISLVTSNLDEFDSSLVFELKPEDNTEEEQHIVYSTPAKDIQDSEAYDLEAVKEFEFEGDDSIELSEAEDELRISSDDVVNETSDFDKEFDESTNTASMTSNFTDLEDNFSEEAQGIGEADGGLSDESSWDFEDSDESEDSEIAEDSEEASEDFDDFDDFDETQNEYSEEYSDTEDEVDGIPLDEVDDPEDTEDTTRDSESNQDEFSNNGDYNTEYDDIDLSEEQEEYDEPDFQSSELQDMELDSDEIQAEMESEHILSGESERELGEADSTFEELLDESDDTPSMSIEDVDTPSMGMEDVDAPSMGMEDADTGFNEQSTAEPLELAEFDEEHEESLNNASEGLTEIDEHEDILRESSDAFPCETSEDGNTTEEQLGDFYTSSDESEEHISEEVQDEELDAIELSEDSDEQTNANNTEEILASLFGGSDDISTTKDNIESDELVFNSDELSLSSDDIKIDEHVQIDENEAETFKDTNESLADSEDSSQNNKSDIEKSVSDLFGLNGSSNDEEQFSRSMYIKDNESVREYTETNTGKHTEKSNKRSLLGGIRKRNVQNVENDTQKLQTILNTFRNRGSSLVVTGTPCSGVSTLVFNLANIVSDLGYTVLIVDMDTVNRTQAYMSKTAYESVHSLDPENASLKQALNASNGGISKYASIIKPGFHVLTMGLGGDIVTGEKLAPKQKLARFSSSVRNNYNFIIYDMPFDVATNYASDITYTADNVVLACEASNHGVMGLMLAMCNIDSEDMQEVMFTRSQLCLTKYTEFKRILDCNISNARDILRRLDVEVNSLLGIDPEYYFSNLSICGIMDYNTEYENSWFSTKAYSDSPNGKLEFIKLLTNILLKK